MNMHVNWELLLKYLKKECSETENATFESWLSENEGHRKFFDRVAETWAASGDIYAHYQPDADANWKAVERKISTSKIRKIVTSAAFRIAASVAIIIGLGIAGYFYLKPFYSKGPFVYVNAGNVAREIILADGSIIWLNAHSTIIYPENFNGKNRHVILSGMAYFEVNRNPEKPFLVHAGRGLVKVLGTCFYVNTKPSKYEVTVRVNSGKVMFSCNACANKSVVLEYDESAVLSNSSELTKVKAIEENEFAWKTGKIYFDNTSLQDVCEFLSGFFNMEISCSQQTQNLLLTAGFENKTSQEVVNAIKETLELKVDTVNAKIVFTSK